MYLAVRRRLSALEIVARSFVAGIISARPAEDVHHVFLSMLLAVHRRLAASDIKERPRRAGVM